ncbi:MAG: hypothetical protein SGARI_002377 [Bacillariaceae sp.]
MYWYHPCFPKADEKSANEDSTDVSADESKKEDAPPAAAESPEQTKEADDDKSKEESAAPPPPEAAAEETPATPPAEAESSPENDKDGDDDANTFDPNEVSYAFAEPPPLSEESQKKIDALFEKILWLDMIEVHLLTQVVNENLGISWEETEQGMRGGGGGGVAKGAGGGAEAEAEPVEAKTIFDLKLVGFDAKAKIKVIKEVRTIAGLGLKEAKELVESAPKVIQKELKQEKAEELKAQLEAVGAEIELA